MATGQTGPRGRKQHRRRLKEAIRQAVRQAAKDGRGVAGVNVTSRVNRAVAANVGEPGSTRMVVSVQNAPVRQRPPNAGPSDRQAR